VVEQPAFFSEIPSQVAGAEQLASRYVLPGNLDTPRSVVSSLGFEHRFPGNMTALVNYTVERGDDLLRNVAAASVREGGLNEAAGADGPVFTYQSSGRSARQELLVSLRGAPVPAVTFSAGYTLGVRRSDTEGPATTLSNAAAADADYSYSNGDRRHRGMFSVSLALPWQISVAPFATIASGRPLNITTGRDNNGDTVFNDRPAFASAGDSGAVATPFGVFNPDPKPGDRIVPRNYARDGVQMGVDLRVSKAVTTSHDKSTTFTVAVENLFNRANPGGSIGVLTSSAFGQVRRTGTPRRVTLSAGWHF
jgi:hypothetical protein